MESAIIPTSLRVIGLCQSLRFGSSICCASWTRPWSLASSPQSRRLPPASYGQLWPAGAAFSLQKLCCSIGLSPFGSTLFAIRGCPVALSCSLSLVALPQVYERTANRQSPPQLSKPWICLDRHQYHDIIQCSEVLKKHHAKHPGDEELNQEMDFRLGPHLAVVLRCLCS